MSYGVEITHRLDRAARSLVEEHFAVQAGEAVLLTTDPLTDTSLVSAIVTAVTRAGGKPVVATLPQLPFQGALADPYIPEPLTAAVTATDVWFDLCFPYLAGSMTHDRAMAARRARYALIATSSASSFARLYGGVAFAALMDLQLALIEYLETKAGARVRLTCPLGSDVQFTLDKIKLPRQRIARSPGMHTVPGAQSLYPAAASVRGRVVLQSLFDEHYRLLRKPVTIEIDERIVSIGGAGAEDRPGLERALRRAAGGRDLGQVIHFTLGFHPAARITGEHFIEDIRALGTNAVGMGLPWWEPGGGENHPDGVVMDQSVWIADECIVDAGQIVAPETLRAQFQRLSPLFD